MTLTVRIDADQAKAFGRALKALPEKEWKFAKVLTLTKTAFAAENQVRRELPSRFNIKRQWVVRQVKAQRASTSNVVPESAVYMTEKTNYFAGYQERGGIKRGRGKSLAIPQDAAKNKRGAVPRSKRPKQILNSSGSTEYFIAPVKAGSSKNAVFARRKKARVKPVSVGKYKGNKRQPVKLMYVFAPQVRVKPALRLHETVQRVARKQFPIETAKAIERIERQLAEKAKR